MTPSDTNSDVKCAGMEERYCELVSFIQGKMKVLDNSQIMLAISEPSAKVKLAQLSSKF